MRSLLIIKEQIKKFVGRNDVFIFPILKFLVTYMALKQINDTIGFQAKLTNGAIVLMIALAGSFLPMNLTIVILAGICLVHIFSVSFELTILMVVLFLVMFLLYFRFSSKDAVGVMLVPLSFAFKIPYVLPVSMGLVGSPASMVSTGCGVITYFTLKYIGDNAEALTHGMSEMDITSFKDTVNAVLMNKTMIAFAVAFAATVLVVYIIRRMSIPYSWTIAITLGSLGNFIMLLMLNSSLGGSISGGEAFAGAIISIILNLFLQYFLFDLDYNRTEKVQFEDDEYYYYVKAVPKNTVKLPSKGKNTRKAPVKRNVVKTSPIPVRQRPSAGAIAKEALDGDDLIEEVPVRRPVRREGVANVTKRPDAPRPVRKTPTEINSKK